MLKPKLVERVVYRNVPAAFGRLCVETFNVDAGYSAGSSQPPSGGCVLKLFSGGIVFACESASRLRAAVC